MASPFIYTPRRRMMMQIFLFIVLLAAVGLAALVDRQRNAGTLITLGSVQTSGPVHIRFPANWLTQSSSAADPRVAAVAREVTPPNQPLDGRTLILYRQRLRQIMSPGDYLDRVSLLGDVFGEQPPEATEATLAGQPAIELEGMVQITSPLGEFLQSELMICCIFPNHQAVTLRLSRQGRFTPLDRILFNQVAKTVTVD
jgi:hypothetical protein